MEENMPEELPGVPQPITVSVDGRYWHLFEVEFDTAEGKFSTHIYAISAEHASHVVEELKATARLAGQVCGVYSA